MNSLVRGPQERPNLFPLNAWLVEKVFEYIYVDCVHATPVFGNFSQEIVEFFAVYNIILI